MQGGLTLFYIKKAGFAFNKARFHIILFYNVTIYIQSETLIMVCEPFLDSPTNH